MCVCLLFLIRKIQKNFNGILKNIPLPIFFVLLLECQLFKKIALFVKFGSRVVPKFVLVPTFFFTCRKMILRVPLTCNAVIFFLRGYSDGPSGDRIKQVIGSDIRSSYRQDSYDQIGSVRKKGDRLIPNYVWKPACSGAIFFRN